LPRDKINSEFPGESLAALISVCVTDVRHRDESDVDVNSL
jgi:hypothetical protein